jgi:hypothetical protein
MKTPDTVKMIFLDVLYVALSTIGIMALLQFITFAAVRILYPPEPQVIYRNVPIPPVASAPPPVIAPQTPFGGSTPLFPSADALPVFTQAPQEVQLPEYEQRVPTSTTSARLDTGLPNGIQEGGARS